MRKYIEISSKNKSAVVNQYRESSQKNIFISGNVLHIHDLADNATEEGEIAGLNASKFAQNKLPENKVIPIECGNGIAYTIPQNISLCNGEKFGIYFRSRGDQRKVFVKISSGESEIIKKFYPAINSGTMEKIEIEISNKMKNNLKIEILN